MTGKQLAVLWMGIALIAAQFYFGGQWRALFGAIKGKTPAQKQTNPVISQSGTPNPNNPVFGPKGPKPL